MKTARFTLDVADRAVGMTLIREWSARAALTIRRARVSPERSRFDLEIRGSVAAVDRALRQSGSPGSARVAAVS